MSLLVEEIDLPPVPHLLFKAIDTDPYGFLLESSLIHPRYGQFSFLGSRPFLVLKTKGKEVQLAWEGGNWRGRGHPLDLLQDLLAVFRTPAAQSDLPFTGGAVGCFAYDLGRQIEKLPEQALDDLQAPDIYLGFYDTLVAIDHGENRASLIARDMPPIFSRQPDAHTRLRALRSRLHSFMQKVTDNPAQQIMAADPGGSLLRPTTQDISRHPSRAARPPAPPDKPLAAHPNIFANFTREEYCQAVQRAKDYIAAGDIFQVNLSQRLVTTWTSDPYQLYCRLRAINPAPFAAFLRYPEVCVVSSSPERFLRLKGRQVETRPIKGTRPRGRNPEEDIRLRRELWESPKDRAELVMIVDLERNDLGRVCQFGSIKVPELFTLEEYASVFHLVSTVTGTLKPGFGFTDLLAATFPGGSITGAPKIRAMEIIEELEPVRRGIYTGSIGWVGFNGDADLNIVIRTFVVKEGRAYFHAGGGIVADSSPEAEYQETLDKARALMQAVTT